VQDFLADDCIADWFSTIHDCVSLQNNVLSRPNWRLRFNLPVRWKLKFANIDRIFCIWAVRSSAATAAISASNDGF